MLPPHILFIALGKLLDFIITEVMAEIFKLRDISEVESTRLAETLQFVQIDTLFISNSESLTPNYSTHISHFKTLLRLLTWSFSSIMEHFRMGALCGFENKEIVHLVKALFSDTPLREKNLAEIEG